MMTEKEKIYWQGIAKVHKELPTKKPDIDDAMQFLDDAYLFVKSIKGQVPLPEPTEPELYKKWINRHKG